MLVPRTHIPGLDQFNLTLQRQPQSVSDAPLKVK